MPRFIDFFFNSHPWASEIIGSVLGVFITALLFIAGIIYERRRQRALEARVYNDALYYFEQLLAKTVAWAAHRARAYRNLADGLRRAPLQPAEFAQLSDSAAQRLLEIDRQLLFKAFLHRYGRETGTIDLYVSLYDGLDYVLTQGREADAARAGLLEGSRALEIQFRKHLDTLQTQLLLAERNLAAAADVPPGLLAPLADILSHLNRLTLPGAELEEAYQIVVEPLQRTLEGPAGTRAEVQDILVRARKLLNIRTALVQQATEAAAQLALFSTGLQLGATTLQSAQERLKTASAVQPVGAGWWQWQRPAAPQRAARASSPSLSAQAETRMRVRS